MAKISTGLGDMIKGFFGNLSISKIFWGSTLIFSAQEPDVWEQDGTIASTEIAEAITFYYNWFFLPHMYVKFTPSGSNYLTYTREEVPNDTDWELIGNGYYPEDVQLYIIYWHGQNSSLEFYVDITMDEDEMISCQLYKR